MSHNTKDNFTLYYMSRPPYFSRTGLSLETLTCIATLGLMATTADREPKSSEIRCFVNSFRKTFNLEKTKTLNVVNAALKRIINSNPKKLLLYSCNNLNVNLDIDQKVLLIDIISDVLVCDRVTTEGEEFYLCYLIYKLNMVGELEGNIDKCYYAELPDNYSQECKEKLVSELSNLQ